MRVEVVDHEMPLGHLWLGGDGACDVGKEIGLIASAAARTDAYLTGGDIKVDDQRERAVANVFEFSPFHVPRLHRQARMLVFEGLHTGHFIAADHSLSLFSPCWRLLVETIDGFHLLSKLLIRLRRQPITDAMRLEVSSF